MKGICLKFRLCATRDRTRPNAPASFWNAASGFSLVELLVGMAILGTLAAIAVPVYTDQVDKAMIARSVTEIRGLERAIKAFETDNDVLPDSLGDVLGGNIRDPWGNPYQYLRLTGAPGEKPRKDRFLVPVNTDFDLYSMGEDGNSNAPFTAEASRDDIVRAADGAFVGLAIDF